MQGGTTKLKTRPTRDRVHRALEQKTRTCEHLPISRRSTVSVEQAGFLARVHLQPCAFPSRTQLLPKTWAGLPDSGILQGRSPSQWRDRAGFAPDFPF